MENWVAYQEIAPGVYKCELLEYHFTITSEADSVHTLMMINEWLAKLAMIRGIQALIDSDDITNEATNLLIKMLKNINK